MGRVHVWETKPAHKRCKEIERLQQSRTEIETETTDTQKKRTITKQTFGVAAPGGFQKRKEV